MAKKYVMLLNDFDLYCKKSGKMKYRTDTWDPLHRPRKVDIPKFVKKDGKVYQEVDGKLRAIHGPITMFE